MQLTDLLSRLFERSSRRWGMLLLLAVLALGGPGALAVIAQTPQSPASRSQSQSAVMKREALSKVQILQTPELADAKVNFERWYLVNMDGQRAGWLHAQELEHNGQLVDRTQMLIEIRRGAFALRIETLGTFRETKDGQPVEAVSTQKISQMATTTTLRFEDEKITVITEQGNQKNERSVMASSQPWMTPAALSRHLQKELEAGKKEIKAWSIEPSLGPDPFETTLTVVDQQPLEVTGKVVPATVMKSTTSRMPGVVSTLYADEQGKPVKMNLGMGGINLEVVEADKAVALAPIDPPQLLASMLIKPARPIAGPRQLRQGVFELRIAPNEDDGQAIQLPEGFLPRGAYQKVVWGDQRTARVVVDLDSPVEPGDDLPGKEDKNASTMLDSQDAKVRELANRALANVPANASDLAKAEALRKFVYQYIDKKDLSVGFASAGEVARTGQGDCTEHAVLLAAMLRAQDLPSRTVSGLVYVDEFEGQRGIFGYHMWTRVWITSGQDARGQAIQGGRWVDLDATLDPDQPFDATHIALGTSSLSQGVMANDMLILAPVLGRLSIQPIE